MLNMNDRTKGFLALSLAAFIFSFFGYFIRLQSNGFTDSGQLFYRSLWALLIVAIIIILKKCWILYKSEFFAILVFSAASSFAVLLFTISIGLTKASNVVMMLYVGGIITAFVFGTLLFKENITKLKVFSILLAIIGLVIFAYPFNITGIALIGIITGLASGFFDATANSLRKLIKMSSKEVMLFFSFTVSIILTGLISLNNGFVNSGQTVEPVAYIAGFVQAFLIVIVGYLLIYGFRHIDVNIGTIVLTSEIFISLGVNSLLLNETPSIYEFIGAVVIFFACVLVGISSLTYTNKKSKQSKRSL